MNLFCFFVLLIFLNFSPTLPREAYEEENFDLQIDERLKENELVEQFTYQFKENLQRFLSGFIAQEQFKEDLVAKENKISELETYIKINRILVVDEIKVKDGKLKESQELVSEYADKVEKISELEIKIQQREKIIENLMRKNFADLQFVKSYMQKHIEKQEYSFMFCIKLIGCNSLVFLWMRYMGAKQQKYDFIFYIKLIGCNLLVFFLMYKLGVTFFERIVISEQNLKILEEYQTNYRQSLEDLRTFTRTLLRVYFSSSKLANEDERQKKHKLDQNFKLEGKTLVGPFMLGERISDIYGGVPE